MIARFAVVMLLCAFVPGVQGQSLWQPGFSGYITGKSGVTVGDTVLVSIDTNTKLSYSSSNVSDGTLSLQFSGGQGTSLFSFLPTATASEKQNVKGSDELAMSGSLLTRVAEVDARGLLFVQGSRSMQVGGKQQLLTVSGWVDPHLLQGGRQIPFGDLLDAKLTYSTILQPSQPVLTQADLTQVMQQLAASNAQGAAPAPGAPAPAAAPAGAAQPQPPAPAAAQPAPGAAPAGAAPLPAPGAAAGTTPGAALPAGTQPAAGAPPASQPTYALTDQAKRELLLQYLNAILNLVFQPPAAASGAGTQAAPGAAAGTTPGAAQPAQPVQPGAPIAPGAPAQGG